MRDLLRRVTFGIAGLALCAGFSQTASSADLPFVKAAPAALVPAPTWTGIYLGAHVGAGWGTIESNTPVAGVLFPISSHTTNGMIGGFQGGYNHQFGWMVLGVEASGSWSGIKGSAPCVVVITCSTNNNWLTS